MFNRTTPMSNSSCFFFGMAIGGAAALLLAPQAGRDTRSRIQEGVRTGREKIANSADYVSRHAKDTASSIKRKSNEAVEAGKRLMGRQKEEALASTGYTDYRDTISDV